MDMEQQIGIRGVFKEDWSSKTGFLDSQICNLDITS